MDKTQTSIEHIEDLLKTDFYKLENSEALQNIYLSDPENFRKAYLQFRAENKDYAFLLLAIMVRNNKELEELSKEKEAIIQLCDDASKLKDGVKLTDILEGTLSSHEDVFEGSYLHHRSRTLVTLSCFYNYVEEVKTIYDYLYKNMVLHNDHQNFNYLSDCFLIGQVQYMKRQPLDTINSLLENDAYTLKILFLAYSNHSVVMGWGDSDHLNAQVVSILVKNNKEEAINLLSEIENEDAELISRWIDMLYNIVEIDDYAPLISYLSHKNHILRKKCKDLIFPHEDKIRATVEKAFSETGSNFLKEIIEEWDDNKSRSFTNEKGISIFCSSYLDKKKKVLTNWIPEDIFEGVNFLSGEKASDAVQFIITKYLLLSEPKRIKVCDDITNHLHAGQLEILLHKVYNLWQEKGCNPKHKMIVIPFILFGTADAIDILAEQIPAMFKSSRSAIATLAIKAIALKENDKAIKIVGNMALYREWTGAIESVEELAKIRNVSTDELEDIFTPDFEFDKNGMKPMQYGESLLYIKLLSDFSLSITDKSGNTRKNIATAIPDVNTEIIDKAKKDFSELKKQLQEVSKMQEVRLSKVLINGRKWEKHRWLQLFMEHPLMRNFIYHLLWGAYDGDRLISPFIVTQDNQIISTDKAPNNIPDKYKIGLVHPVEIGEQQIKELYAKLPECTMLSHLRSIALSTSSLSEIDTEGNKITKYSGITIPKDIDILKFFDTEYNNSMAFWDIYGFYFRDRYLNIEAILKCKTHYKLYKDTQFGELVFYRYSDRQRYEYEQITDRFLLDPREVPEKFVNSVLSICDRLTRDK